jgi:hypothetical protein
MNAAQKNLLAWERHLAAMIVAGSHSHKGDTSLPLGRWPGMVSWMIIIALQSSAFSLNS